MREIFAAALGHGAAGLVVAHNHPSGDPQPSRSDIAATRRLAETGGVIYRFENVMGERTMERTLVAEAAGVARDAGQQVVVLVGRRLGPDLAASGRRTAPCWRPVSRSSNI